MTEVQTAIVPGDQEVALAGNEDTGIIGRQLDLTNRPQNIVVSAKVVIRNDDGDSQNAAVRLRVLQTVPDPDRPGLTMTKEIEIDRADIRLGPGQFGSTVSLLGWVTPADPGDPAGVFKGIVTPNPFVEVLARTFRGVVQKTRIAVTVVDTLT